jgi:hypothetical protein
MGQTPSSEPDGPFDSALVIDDSLTAFDAAAERHSELGQSVAAIFSRTDVATNNFIRHNIPDIKENKEIMLHKNILHYFGLAWSVHASVVLSPDMVFYTLISEFAGMYLIVKFQSDRSRAYCNWPVLIFRFSASHLDEIKSQPSKYSELFTKTPDSKKVITVVTDSIEKIDLAQLVEKIQKELPIDGSIFTAKFSTSTQDSLLAMNAAFADAVSPFFEYRSTLCGIPRVRRLGTKQDWQSIESKIEEWIKIIAKKGKDTKSTIEWLKQAAKIVGMIHTRHDSEFWSKIFNICNCGSGHMDDAEGWIIGLYRSGRLAGGEWMYHGPTFYYLPSHISTVNWTNEETQRKFSLYTGLFWRCVSLFL